MEPLRNEPEQGQDIEMDSLNNNTMGDGAQPMGDGAQPMGDGAQPMVDGAQPRGDGAQPRGNGAQPMGDGAQPMEDGAQPRGDGAQPRGNGAQPMGDGAQPMGDGAQPRGNGAQPRGNGAQPMGDGAQPMGDGAQPRRDGAQPRGDGAQPRGDGAQPRGDGAQPRGDGAQPRGDGAQPRGDGAQPRGDGAQPRGDGAQPRGDGAQPRGDGAQPRGDGAQPRGDVHSTWSKQLLVFIVVLLCIQFIIIVILLGVILGLLVHLSATGAVTCNNGYPNFTELANNIVSRVNQSLGFDELTNGVVSQVNSNVTGSLPDFNEWANGVVSKVNSNVTGSLPDFNEWANGVVSQVNSNVTGSLPDFDEWANGVSQNILQLFQDNTNFTELDKQILQTIRDSAQKLINIVNTLSNLQDTSTSTAGVVDDILLIAQEVLVLLHNLTALPTSCKEIKERQPLSPSGVYVLSNFSATYITYCNMDELCGSGGGWTRLAFLNMSDATQNCPSGFRLYQSGGVRACGRPKKLNSFCVSVQFPSNGISYSQICGRVTGYQFSSVDAFHPIINDINSVYVDGVSITRGSPRQHVWTLANGLTDSYNNYPQSMCPCSTGSTQTVPSFVENHYFCESGNNASTWSDILYTSDPLWDGQGCGDVEAACCSATGIPWFHRDYGSTTTTDYIELRVCGSVGSSGEDSPVGYYEIYVK